MGAGRLSERGQALILIVFGIIALFGVTALAVDGGNAYSERRKAQNAADAAALAGALARVRGGQNWVQVTLDAAARNGYDNNGASNTVKISSPPFSGPYKGKLEYIQVQITSHVGTYFARVIGVGVITNQVEAMARTVSPQYTQMVFGNAVVSLAPASDCDNKKAFWVHSEATLDMYGGGVFVNSSNPTCALIQQGNGSIRINDDSTINIVGGASVQKPQLLTPYPPTTNALPLTYPPPFLMPKVGCSKEAGISPDGHSMSSGWWDDTFPPPGVDHLGSGIYCLNGDFIMSGDRQLIGESVVIKVENGRLRFSGTAQISLTAPTGGELAGLLIYQPIENHNYIVLNGNFDSRFRGTILAPGAEIRINGNDSKYGFHSQIIGYRIDVDGDSNIIIAYKDEQNYDALAMPEIQLIK